MRRRTFVGAAISLAAMMSVQACGTGPEASTSNEGKTLRVLVSAKAAYPEQQKEWFGRIADRFKSETGATVEFSTFATAEDELKVIQTSAISGTGPDIFSLGTSMTPTADATGAFSILAAEDWNALGGRDKFVPGSLGISGASQDKEIAVPFINRPYVMAYNTKMFADAGITSPPESWDEFRETAKKLTKDGVYGAAIAYGDQYDPWKFIWTMAAAQGNHIVDGDTVRIDDPTVRNAYSSFFGFLTDDKVVDPASVGWKNAQAVAAFGEGKAAMMMLTTSGSYPTLTKSSIKDDFKYAVMPLIAPGQTAISGSGVQAAGTLAGDNMAIAKYTKNKDLALKLLGILTSNEEQLNYAKVFGEFPTTKEASKQVEVETPAFAPAVKALGISPATPYTGAWGEVQVALSNVVVQSRDEMTRGSVSKESLDGRLAKAQQDAQSAITRAGGR